MPSVISPGSWVEVCFCCVAQTLLTRKLLPFCCLCKAGVAAHLLSAWTLSCGSSPQEQSLFLPHLVPWFRQLGYPFSWWERRTLWVLAPYVVFCRSAILFFIKILFIFIRHIYTEGVNHLLVQSSSGCNSRELSQSKARGQELLLCLPHRILRLWVILLCFPRP